MLADILNPSQFTTARFRIQSAQNAMICSSWRQSSVQIGFLLADTNRVNNRVGQMNRNFWIPTKIRKPNMKAWILIRMARRAFL